MSGPVAMPPPPQHPTTLAPAAMPDARPGGVTFACALTTVGGFAAVAPLAIAVLDVAAIALPLEPDARRFFGRA